MFLPQMRKAIAQMQRLTAAHQGTTLATDEGVFTADKQVQTDFPAGMLEDYVVKNRKRILKLLGLSGNGSGSQSGSFVV